MYHYTLEFVLVGLDAETVSVFRGLSPLPRFSHHVGSYPSLDAVPLSGRQGGSGNTILVLADNVDWTRDGLRDRFGGAAHIILCTQDAARLGDDIWPLPLTEALARRKGSQLQDRIKQEKDAWLCREYLDRLIDMLPDMVWFKDMPGCHLKLNRAFCEAVGKTPGDVTGKYHGYIWGLSEDDAEHGEAVCRESEEAVARAGHTCHFEETVRHAVRGLCELSILKTPVYDEDGKVIGTIGIARDITREKEAHAQILQLAHTDALTGLANRRYFYDYIDENRKEQPMTICYIDLDHFKELNDTWGHQSGDAALLGVAELLRITFPKDFITRLGGDEFVVAILGLSAREAIEDRMRYLMRAAKDFFQLDECLTGLSMSIGIASTDQPSTSLDSLLRCSDRALYYSKEHGRDIYCFYEDIS